ncbi:unnamed protein product [Peniophora sp. CBMAI 1063]|nr:unnamed protein product [Peniophora sp. CBMAI 1063]
MPTISGILSDPTEDAHNTLRATFCYLRLQHDRTYPPNDDSSDDDENSAPPSRAFGPPNPYDPPTLAGERLRLRHRSLAVPTAVDRWLDANRCSWLTPDPRVMNAGLHGQLATCKVMRIFNQSYDKPETDSFWLLKIQVILGEDSGVRAGLRESPRAILARWAGDGEPPDWVMHMRNGQTHTFTQPRGVLTDTYAALANNLENIDAGISPAILRWAREASPVQQMRITLRRRGRAPRNEDGGTGLRRSRRKNGRKKTT